jgi:hypothetical protein
VIEVVNVLACSVMLFIAALVAIEMPHRGMWGRKVLLWLVLAALAAEVTNPWAKWLPPATWPSAIVHALFAVVLLRSKFQAGRRWGQRSTDFGELDSQPHEPAAGGR